MENEIILGTQYIVEQGDSLYSISQRFNTDIDTLKKINKMTSDNLHPGQIIFVDDMYTPGKKEIYTRYTVQPEDTIYKIAFLYNMTPQELKDLNDLMNDEIKIGQVFLVNNIYDNNYPDKIYTVEKGDSIYSIAKKYKTTADKIKKLNNLTDNKINIGEKLIVFKNVKLEEDDQEEKYIVLPGDNLYAIANKKNTTVKKLKNINNLSSNNLQIGQELIIPKQ